MELLPHALAATIPALYSQESEPDPKVPVKFFTPDSSWTWYVTEFDGEDEFFGYVDGQEGELGYFLLSEMRSARGPLGLPIERDLHWNPETRLSAVRPS